MDRIKDSYKSLKNQFILKEKKVKERLIIISILRFIFFILAILSIVYIVKDFSFLKLILSIALFASFLSLVSYYVKQTILKNHYKNLVLINEQELKVLENDFSFFYNGSDYTNREHPYSFDLDLFGEGSLYQYLNRAFTLEGRNHLARTLQKPGISKNEILNKQKAVKELTPKIEWRQNITALGYACPVTKEDNKKLELWIKDPSYFSTKVLYKILVTFLPIITLSFLALSLTGITNLSWFAFFGLLQLLIASTLLRKTNRQQNLVSEELRILKNYSKLIKAIEKETFSSEILKQLQNKLQSNGINAGTALKKLIKIIDALDTRLNIFLGVILNATLMWDLYCMIRLEKWKVNYGRNIKNWIQVIAEFDYYCSIANYNYNNPSFIFPDIVEDTIINGTSIGHPLIPGEKRVNNNFSVNAPGNIIIITGANMAGKSTFLRTIGVNLVMAMNGLPVCANQFSFCTMDIFSGMRTADSLKENESYFYAELKRLKQIVSHIKNGNKTFVLLDEILKGTNSIDKAEGSWKFIEYLVELNATGIVATHDLTLCGLEKKYPVNIKNKCFEVDIEDHKISFDYKLRDGITQNMNASILMKQMNIFPS